jgi:hypothetical protein
MSTCQIRQELLAVGADGLFCIKAFHKQSFEIEGNWRKQTQVITRSRVEWAMPVRAILKHKPKPSTK